MSSQKSLHHEFIAEVFGGAVIMIIGGGALAAQPVVEHGSAQPDPYAKSLWTNAAWGLGVCFGVMVSFNTSGAMLNPALQLNSVINETCTVRKASIFVLAQTLGFFLGAALVTLNFVALKASPELSNFYCTHPGPGVSFLNAALNEIIGTALLAISIAGITNRQPMHSKFSVAGFVGAFIFIASMIFGPQSGFAANPARDLGPRMCYLIAAWIHGGVPIWDEVMGGGYFLVPIFAPLLGAVVGDLLYRHCIFLEAEGEQLEDSIPSTELHVACVC